MRKPVEVHNVSHNMRKPVEVHNVSHNMHKPVEVQKLIVTDRENRMANENIKKKYSILIRGARKIYEKYKSTGTCNILYGGEQNPVINEHDACLFKWKVISQPEISVILRQKLQQLV